MLQTIYSLDQSDLLLDLTSIYDDNQDDEFYGSFDTVEDFIDSEYPILFDDIYDLIDDFFANIDDRKILLVGDYERWNGSNVAYKICDSVSELVTADENFQLLIDENFQLWAKYSNHDSSNWMKIQLVSDSTIERLENSWKVVDLYAHKYNTTKDYFKKWKGGK